MKTLYTFLVFLFSLSLACAASLCDFPAIFNFGDSNSDTGGLSAAFGQAGPPAGESFFHGPAGRYCDGRLVIDFIGKERLHTYFTRKIMYYLCVQDFSFFTNLLLGDDKDIILYIVERI